MITPCEIFYAALARCLSLSARGAEECRMFGLPGVVFDGIRPSMAALCFLSDRVKFSRCIEFASINDCVACLIKNFPQVPYATIITVLQSMNFPSIEIMEEFIVSLEVLSRSDPNHNLNGVASPIVIDRNSHLGTFIRRVCLDFDTMTFEQHCDLLNSIKIFLDAFNGNSSTFNGSQQAAPLADVTIENLPFKLGRSNDIVNSGDSVPSIVSNLAFEAVKAFYFGDIAKSEDNFHKLFDYNGEMSSTFPPIQSLGNKNLPAAAAAANKQKINTEVAIRHALHNLKHALFEADLSVGRYQHTMMCLSSVWVQRGCVEKAWAGVEEALRIAHQKGDHATIAQALLLIYHIGNIKNSSASQEGGGSYMAWSRFTNLMKRHYKQDGSNNINSIGGSNNLVDSFTAGAGLEMSTSDISISHDLSESNESMLSSASKPDRKSGRRDAKDSDAIVWHLQSDQHEDDWDGEDILLRCMERCDRLKLPRLSSQSSLLFCQHKIRNIVVPSCAYNFVLSGSPNTPAFPIEYPLNKDYIDSSFIIKNLVYNDSSSRHPIQLLWTQLMSTSFGDTRLINALAKMSDVSQLESVLTALLTESGANKSATLYPKLANHEHCHDASEMTQVGVQVHLLSACIWIRQGLFDMALLEYRRLLRNYFKYIPNHSLVSILCSATSCVLEYGYWCYTLDNKGGRIMFTKAISLANSILKTLKSTFPCSLPVCIHNTIEFHRKLLLAYNHLLNKNYEMAFKATEVCVSMAGGASVDAIIERICNHSRSSDDVISTNRFGEMYADPANMLKVLLLHLEAYIHVDKTAAILLLHQFEYSKYLDKFIDIKYQFIALRAKMLIDQRLPLYEDSILTSQQLFYISNHLGIPTLIKHLNLSFLFR